jgi:hypothetical protein
MIVAVRQIVVLAAPPKERGLTLPPHGKREFSACSKQKVITMRSMQIVDWGRPRLKHGIMGGVNFLQNSPH